MSSEINSILKNTKSTQLSIKDSMQITDSPQDSGSNNSPKLVNAGYFTPPTSPDILTNCPPTPVHQKTPGNVGDEILKKFNSAGPSISKRCWISPTRQNKSNCEIIKKKCLNGFNISNNDLNSNTRTVMPYSTYHRTSISENSGFTPLIPTSCKPTPTKILSINRNPYSPCNPSLSSYSNIELPCDASPARLLLDFHLEQEIGKGSFGSVILCTHRMDGWSYAVKCIHFTTCRQRDRLINEVYLMASFSHPNIVEYHSSWMDESNIYIQMEYCNGGSLETWWKYNQDSSFAERESKLCKIIQHIALALDYLHTQENAVHLDIKPANIFVQHQSSSYYTYKLGDFGSMQKIPLSNESFNFGNGFLGYKKRQELNLSKIECDDIDEGDGRYLAPELLKDQVDVKLLGRADIYAVGCSILELAGGQLLPNHSEFSREDMKPPVLLPRGYSAKFSSLIGRMLNPDPSKRPSAHVLLMDQEINSTESRILLLQKEVYQLQQENRLMREQLHANSINYRLNSL